MVCSAESKTKTLASQHNQREHTFNANPDPADDDDGELTKQAETKMKELADIQARLAAARRVKEEARQSRAQEEARLAKLAKESKVQAEIVDEIEMIEGQLAGSEKRTAEYNTKEGNMIKSKTKLEDEITRLEKAQSNLVKQIETLQIRVACFERDLDTARVGAQDEGRSPRSTFLDTTEGW